MHRQVESNPKRFLAKYDLKADLEVEVGTELKRLGGRFDVFAALRP